MPYRSPHGPGTSTSLGSAVGFGALTGAVVVAAYLMDGSHVAVAILPAIAAALVIFSVLYGYGRITGKKTTGEGLPSRDEYWDEQYKKADPSQQGP